MELEWDLVVRVEARRGDDLQVGAGGHLLDARDVAAEPEHGGVEDRVDPELLELLEIPLRLSDAGVLVPVLIVDPVLLAEHEDMLVDERPSEVRAVDRSRHRLHLCHTVSSSSGRDGRTTAAGDPHHITDRPRPPGPDPRPPAGGRVLDVG